MLLGLWAPSPMTLYLMMCVGAHLADLGSLHSLLWLMEERERLMRITGHLTGSRLHPMWILPGGVAHDPDHGEDGHSHCTLPEGRPSAHPCYLAARVVRPRLGTGCTWLVRVPELWYRQWARVGCWP